MFSYTLELELKYVKAGRVLVNNQILTFKDVEIEVQRIKMALLKKTESAHYLLVCCYLILALLLLLWLSEFGSLSLSQYLFWILGLYLNLYPSSTEASLLIP